MATPTMTDVTTMMTMTMTIRNAWLHFKMVTSNCSVNSNNFLFLKQDHTEMACPWKPYYVDTRGVPQVTGG
jgi:hypothetical protein